MAEIKHRLYDTVISFFDETDENIKVLEILLLKMCSTDDELNHVYNYKHHQRCSILMIAVLEGRINLVKMLLTKFRKLIDLEVKGAMFFSSRMISEITALWMATARKNFQMVKLLIENGADVSTVNNYNVTPLHIASASGRTDIVKYLVEEAQGDVNRVNKGNATCLNLAGLCGRFEVIQYLLQQPDVDVNHQGNNLNKEYTTLHWLVKYNEIESVKLLLSHNARVDIKNAENMTPLEMAAEDTKEEIVKYMLSIEDLIGVNEKIDALELIGASFACREKRNYNLDKAYEYLMQAMELRVSSGNMKTSLMTLVQPIAAYNYRTESLSIAQLESIRYEDESLHLEALLIRERFLLPATCTELLLNIWYEGCVYADQQMYDRCIDLWLHGLELSIRDDHVSMNVIDHQDRVIYISRGVREFGELYLEILSAECNTISMTIFLRILKFSINQFIRLCPKRVGSKKVLGKNEHNHFLDSILFIIYVSTKFSFDKDEKQQLHEQIRRINRLNFRRKFSGSTLLHTCCDSSTSIKCHRDRNIPSFPCVATIQLLIDCNFDVNSFDMAGNTPLHILLRRVPDSKVSVVEAVLNIFLKTNRLHIDYTNRARMTPLNCTSNAHLIEFLKRKTNISLKCLCAKRLKGLNTTFQNYLSPNLIDFVNRHI